MRPGCLPWRMGLACYAGRMGLWLMGCMTPRACMRLRVQVDHKALCLVDSKAELVAGDLWAPYELVSSKAQPVLQSYCYLDPVDSTKLTVLLNLCFCTHRCCTMTCYVALEQYHHKLYDNHTKRISGMRRPTNCHRRSQ